MRKKSRIDYLSECLKLNMKYDYSLLPNFIGTNDYIKVIKDDLTYIQLSDHHLQNFKPTKIQRDSLISKLEKIHNNRYRYLVDSEKVGTTSKIKLIDNLTGDIFLYRVDRHLSGMCPNKVTLNLFTTKSSTIHNNKYDYSLVEFNTIKDKVKIICPEHGIFIQSVSNHMNLKDGCPKCIGRGFWNKENILKEFTNIHLNMYDYSLVEFKGISHKVKIVCRSHGPFDQNIHKHLSGQGCKLCKSTSKGEECIKLHLEKRGIKYIRQHGFDTCRYINRLSFDFYLPEYNTCIEFDGIQHFRPIKGFGGDKSFSDTIKRDKCKNDWCIENRVKLIRINYNQFSKIPNIIKILKNEVIVTELPIRI